MQQLAEAAREESLVEGEPVGPIRPKGSIGRNPVEARKVIGDYVYQLERIRCGTKTCRCMRSDDPGNWHGPYWYGYTSARAGGGRAHAGGRWRSVYIGREFREL